MTPIAISSAGRPTALGLVDRALALLSMATVKNAHLCDCRPGSVVDLGGAGPVEAGRPARPTRLDARSAPAPGDRGLRRAGARLWTRFLAPGPLVRPSGDRMGLLQIGGPGNSRPDAPLALLYDDWDRNPYTSPFGAFPHDLAVRLFYLGRPASWHFKAEDLPGMVFPSSGMGGQVR